MRHALRAVGMQGRTKSIDARREEEEEAERVIAEHKAESRRRRDEFVPGPKRSGEVLTGHRVSRNGQSSCASESLRS